MHAFFYFYSTTMNVNKSLGSGSNSEYFPLPSDKCASCMEIFFNNFRMGKSWWIRAHFKLRMYEIFPYQIDKVQNFNKIHAKDS